MGTTSISFSILSVIILSVLWTPAYSDDKCSLACVGSASSPSFLNGHTYTYGVDGTVSVFLTGAEKQETNVKIFGQVAVTALDNCVLSLKVNSLSISSPDGKKHQAPKGIEKTVRFSLENGRVGPEICTEEGDHRPSLNIKRAIISLLQTEQKPSTQVDIFGTCPTEVSYSQEGSAVLVHRSRDLSRCAHREQTVNSLVTAVYNPTAEIKNTQILRSVLNVESKVNKGVPEKISAVEEYLYKPFSVGENGARAEVNTKLTLSGTAKGGAAGGNCPVSHSIIFENPHNAHAEHSNAQVLLTAVKDTCKTLSNGAAPKSASAFAQLVRIFRSASKEDLTKVFAQVKGNHLEKRVFIDALLRTGTGFSVETSVHILKSKELSPLEQNLVFLSLGNARHVNSEAVKAAATLLDLHDLPKGVYLGVGALAGTYCRDHNCHLEKSEGIVALSKKFGAKLQNCKPKTKTDEDYVVAVLKGIKNSRHLEDDLINKLVHCVTDNAVKARVKVAALEAFHADPCAAKLKKTALDVMKNRQLDSEIRIKAYLAVIDCPCAKSANEIKNLLDSEPVHQVGRFITSSLRHIRSSANPDKQNARAHYGQIGIPNKFNIDDRKYSFYRELSFNVDALGAGGNMEKNVIYSQDSFIPRSVSMNLTAEIFGHNVNLLEVGGRQGNLDRVLEHFFGPKSFLRTQKPQEVYDNLVQKLDESYKKAEGSVRGRRSIQSEVDNFASRIKAESAPFNNELDLDIYVKLFGTDAVFLSLGDSNGWDYNNFLDQALKVAKEGMDKMKRFQQEFRGHLLFLDAELVYPTSTGLPLKLDFIGAATGRLDVSSAIDVRQIIRSPETAKVDIKLVPSSDVEISLIMLVDTDSVSTGLKVVSNLHSSTGSHVIAKVIENGHGFDLQWGLPIDKQEILTASSEMVFFTAEKGKPEKLTPVKADTEKKEYTACFDQLSGVLGLNLCGELSLPFQISGPKGQESISKFLAKYPLVGSSRVRLVLEKNDLRGYHLKGVLRPDSNQGRYGFELLFDAEGSQNRRTQLTGDFINNNEEKTVKLNLVSPIKNIYGQVSLYTKAKEHILLLKAKLDAAEYYAKAGFNIEGNAKRSVLKPVLEYELPDRNGKQVLKVDGQIVREINGPAMKYSLEGVKIILPNSNEPINVVGHFNKEPKAVEIDVKVKQGQYNMILSGSVKGYDCKLDFQNTLNPYVNFKLNGHFENVEGINHNDIELFYGGDLSNPQNSVAFGQLFKRHSKSTADFNIISKNKFEIRALPLKAKLDFEVDPKKLDIEVEGVYVDRKGSINLEARTHLKKAGDYRNKLVITVDKQTIEALAKRDIVSADKSNFENYIDFKNIGKYELSGVVLHKVKTNDVNVGAVGHLKINSGGKEEDVKFDLGAIQNNNLYSSHATVSSSKGELVDFLLKINRGANANGQLKLSLKDTIAANGKFQVNDKDGKGTGNIMISFVKIQRIIKGDVKFVVKDPVYNADIDLFLNFDKDNNDKLFFSTNTKKTEKLLDSKNKLQYGGQTTEVNVHRDGIIALVGKFHGILEVVLPTERCLSVKFDRDLAAKDNVYNGRAELLVSDAPKRGSPASTIKVQNKLVNTNWDAEVVDFEGQLEVNLKDGQNLLNTYTFKNTPKGEKSEVIFKSEVSGSLIPKKALLDASLLTLNSDSELLKNDDSYRVKASYGDDIVAEIVGTFFTDVPQKGDKKYLDDSTVTIHLPFEKAHDIKWINTFQYLQPEHKDIEITVVESVQINGDLYKVDGNGRYNEKAGATKVKIVVPHVDPIIFDFDYRGDKTGERRSANVDLKAQYGKGKTSNMNLQGVYSPQDYQFKLVANSPSNEKLKAVTVDWHAKNPTPDTYNVQGTIEADGRVYKTDSIVVLSKSQPLVDWKYYSPSSPKVTRLYFKASDLRSTHSQLETKIENFKDFNLEASVEASFDKDMFIKTVADSEKLGLKNYKMDIISKDAGNGKRLEFNAVNDNKNILSGSTSYISKQEGPKTIIEGSGSLKIKEEQKPANFKYIRTFLTEGNEQGVETFVNVAVGDSNHVAESKFTNLEFKSSYVYCEEKKQCAHAEVNSKIVTNKPGSVQQVLNIGLDLRKLGFPTEFGLQSTTDYSDKKLPQYDLNIHVNSESDKIHLHAYSQPEFGKFPNGITISLPSRVLALESLVQYPTDKSLPFPIRFEVNLFPDKNKPATKTGVRWNLDLSGNDKQGETVFLFGFSHPKLGKEALLKLRGSYKRPNDNTLRIETTATASHSSFGRDREAKFCLEASPVHVKLLIDTPVVKVIDLEGSATVKDNLQQADLKFSLLQGKPVQVYAVAKDYQYYEFTTSYSDEADRKLSIVSHLDPEKRIDISVDIILPGHKKNIAHGAVFMENNLIKNDYGVSRENYMYFVNALKKDLSTLKNREKEIGEKISNEFKQLLKRVEPTFQKLGQAYKEDLEKLVQEITNDNSLKEISQALASLAKVFAKMIDDTINVLKPLAEKIADTIGNAIKQLQELYEKQLEPQIKQIYQTISNVLNEYLDGIIDIAAHFSALIIDFFERHKPELQELTNIFTEILRDITRIVIAQLKEWRAKAAELCAELTEQIKNLPFINMIKEKWQELAVPDQFLALLSDAKQTLRQLLPTEESRNFLDALFSYAQKKLRQEKVDEQAELRAVYEKLLPAITSLVQFVRSQIGQYGVPTYPTIGWGSFFGPSGFTVPSLGGSPAVSFITQLYNGDIPDPLSFIKAYRPRSLNPLDEIPAKMRAVVVNGQHIFTFDGRHLTFPGSCRYVLAHDYVDRNFTLMLQLADGNPKALILEDKSGTTIELRENGQAVLNSAVHGYPVIEKDVFAFRQANGRIGLGSLYGLMAFCTAKLEVCYIEVNGFYLGKLRGLLGDGNNEPYDDFRLPNGKITNSEADFGNSYRMATSCPQAKTPEHTHHQHVMDLPPACETVFGGVSPLKPLSFVLDVHQFRQACIHAATGDGEEALHQACDLGRGYAALAVTGLLPAILPTKCVRCNDADKPKEVGDIYEVKLPAKQADIIVLFETTKSNEKIYKDILSQVVPQVIDLLKSKRITDVKLYLVGITSKYPYPILYDTDLKLKSAKVQFDDDSRYNRLEPITFKNEYLDKVEHQIVDIINGLTVKLGINNVDLSYQSLVDLPVRPGAVKHYIGAISERCSESDLLVTLAKSTMNKIWAADNGATHTLIANTPGLKIGGGKAVNQVVGFSKHSVLLAGDKKLKDTEALRATLEVEDDGCVTLAQESDGFVFSASNFAECDPALQKQFLSTMAASVANRMLQESLVRECTCTYVDPFRVRSVCVTKARKEAAIRRK